MKTKLVCIGAPEADATEFEARAQLDFPELNLYATNNRASALEQMADAVIGHHFQFDDDLLMRAKKLAWYSHWPPARMRPSN